MSKTRAILLSILAVFAIDAASTAAASAAPQYMIAGAEFSGEEAVTAQLKPGTNVVLASKLTGGAAIEIVCTASKLSSVVIKENRKGHARAIVYEHCSVKTPLSCKVPETLTTNEVSFEAIDTLEGKGVSVVILPKIGSTFFALSVSGCSFEGVYDITGSMECEGLEPSVEAVDKTCSFTSTSGSNLKFGANTAKLVETAEFFLSGENIGKAWRTRP